MKQLTLSTAVIVMALMTQFDAIGKAIYTDSLTVSNVELAEVSTNRLTRELSLNQQQKKKLYKLFLKRAKEIEKEYTKKHSIEESKLTTINETYKQSISTILTEEQLRQYNEMKKELKAQKRVNGEKVKGKESYQDLVIDF